VGTLSGWLKFVDAAEVYSGAQSSVNAKRDLETRGGVLANAIAARHTATEGRVRVWLMDGAGLVLFVLLKQLKENHKWSDGEIDTRLELTLVDCMSALSEYHAWAIPCANILRGNVHDAISTFPTEQLPHVVYFNYSNTSTSGTTQDMYVPGAYPGSRYGIRHCMRETMSSCRKIHTTSSGAATLVSFSTVRSGVGNVAKMLAAAEAANLKAVPLLSNRCDYAMYTIAQSAESDADASQSLVETEPKAPGKEDLPARTP
jgi:hypothetical protein